MDNARTTDEIESSDARTARLERIVELLTEAIRQQQQQNQQPPLPPVQPEQNFSKMKPPSFQGGLEPLKAEAWVLETEKLFEVFPCSEAHKVLLATFTLQEEAKRRWILVRDTNTKYFPQCVRDRKVFRHRTIARSVRLSPCFVKPTFMPHFEVPDLFKLRLLLGCLRFTLSVSAFGNLGLLAGYGAKPIGAGLGRDRMPRIHIRN
ncbi:hypothetical protein CsSME_00005700 [Camellia sinensis var. sinensis]